MRQDVYCQTEEAIERNEGKVNVFLWTKDEGDRHFGVVVQKRWESVTLYLWLAGRRKEVLSVEKLV